MRKFKILCLFLVVAISLVTLYACTDDTQNEGSNYYIIIHVNNDTEDITWDPTQTIPEINYPGYIIQGIYLDVDYLNEVTLESLKSEKLTNNIDVYIKWIKEESVCEHEIVIDEAVDPTCTNTGLTEGSHCTKCNEIIISQTVIAKLGHDYGEVTYTWSEDYSTCTASRVCKRDNTHVETEIVNSTSVVSQNKTCVLDELTTYTASFKNSAFAIQTKEKIKTSDALGHDFENDICTRCQVEKVSSGLEYEEYDDGYKVVSIGTCNDTEIIIPNIYNEKDVLRIEESAFKNNTNITSIKIPKNLVSIGTDAFNGCTSLKKVVIDNISIPKGIMSSDSFGFIIKYAEKIYITSLTTDISEYIKGIYTLSSSDKDGYDLYTFDPNEVKLTGYASQEIFDGSEDATTAADDSIYIEAGIYVNGIYRCNTVAGGYFYLHCCHGDIITCWMYWHGHWWLCVFIYTVSEESEQSTDFAFNTYLVSGKTYYCGVKTEALIKAASNDPDSEETYYIDEATPDFSIYYVEGSTIYFESGTKQGTKYLYELKDIHKPITNLEINFLPLDYDEIVADKPYAVSGNVSINSGDFELEQIRLVEVPVDMDTKWSYADLDENGNFTIKLDNKSKLYVYCMVKGVRTYQYIKYIVYDSVEENISDLDLDLVLYTGIETITTDAPLGIMDTESNTSLTNKSLNFNNGENIYSIKYYLLTRTSVKTIYTINTIPSGELLGQYTFEDGESTHDFNLEYHYVYISVTINNYSSEVKQVYNKYYLLDESLTEVVVPIQIIDRLRGITKATYEYVLKLEDGVTQYTLDFNKHTLKVYFNGVLIPSDMVSITHIGSTYDNNALDADNFCALNGDKYKFGIKNTSFASSEVVIVDGDIVVNINNDDYFIVVPTLSVYDNDFTSIAKFTYAGVEYSGGDYIFVDSSTTNYEVTCTFTLNNKIELSKSFSGNGNLSFEYIISDAIKFAGNVSYNSNPCLGFITTPQGSFVSDFDGSFSVPVKLGDEITISILSGKNESNYYTTFKYSNSTETAFNFTGNSPLTYGLFDLDEDVRKMNFVDISPVLGKYSMLNNVFMYTLGDAQKQYQLDIVTDYETNTSLLCCRQDIIAKSITIDAKEDGSDAMFYLWRNGEDGTLLDERKSVTHVSSYDTSAIIGERLRAVSKKLTVAGWYFAKEELIMDEYYSSFTFNFERVLVKGSFKLNNKLFNGNFFVNTCSTAIMFTPKAGYSFFNYRGNDLTLEVIGIYNYSFSLKGCEDIVTEDINLEVDTDLVYSTGKVTANGVGINAILMCYANEGSYETLTITDYDGTYALFTPSGSTVIIMNGYTDSESRYFSVDTEDSEIPTYDITLSQEDFVHVSGSLSNCFEMATILAYKEGIEDPGMYVVYGAQYSLFILNESTIYTSGSGNVSEREYKNADTYELNGDNDKCDFDLSYA